MFFLLDWLKRYFIVFFFLFKLTDVDEASKNMKRPSMIERKMRTFADHGNWKAEDYRQFILSQVGLVCSQKRFLPDAKVYKLLCYLSNLVYLMYDPRVTDDKIAEMERNMVLFVDVYHDRIGTDGCTWKFHIFQHFIELIKCHGSALFWDGFFRECILGELKKFLTGTRNEDEQIVANFLLSRHAKDYFDSSRLSRRMKEFIDRERSKFTGASVLGIVCYSYEIRIEITDDERGCVLALYGSDEREVKRVTRCKKRGVVLSSKRFAHRGNVDDSWVFLSDECFGQVEDMFVVNDEEEKSVVVKLRKYTRVEVMDERSSEGEALLFPLNQFIAECNGDVGYYLLDDSVHVQKMSFGSYEHVRKTNDVAGHEQTVIDKYDYVCVWPEFV